MRKTAEEIIHPEITGLLGLLKICSLTQFSEKSACGAKLETIFFHISGGHVIYSLKSHSKAFVHM